MSTDTNALTAPPAADGPAEGDSAPGATISGRAPLLSWRRATAPSAVLILTIALTNVLRIANTMVLTRLLAPEAFGLVGMITSVFFVFTMITDVGFQSFIVRHERGDEPHFLDAVWTVHVTRGVINSALIAILSIPIAWLLDKPQVAPLLAVAGLTLAIDGTASLTLLTALRRNLVRRLSMVDLGAFLTQIAVGIGASAYFHSAWGIITGMLASSIFKSTASYILFPESRRRFGFDRPISGELWRFSRTIAASSMLTLLIAQVDKLFLARMLTLSQFGIYAIASNLASAPLGLAYLYVSRISYPQIARAWREDPKSIKRSYYGTRGIVFFAYLLAAGALIGAGPLVIRMLYDARYAEGSGGTYLRLLAIASTMTMLTRSMQEALIAIGQVRTTLLMNIARIVWLALAGLGGFLALGTIGLVAALGLIELPAYLYGIGVLRKLRMLSIRRELLAFIAIGAGATGGFALNFLASEFF